MAVDAEGWVEVLDLGLDYDRLVVEDDRDVDGVVDDLALDVLQDLLAAVDVGRPRLWVDRVFAVGGSIVAGVNDSWDGAVGDSLLAVIDPTTGALRDTVPLHSNVWLTSDGDQLWAATGDGIERLDPATGAITAGPFAVGTTGDALAVGPDGVSFLVPEGRQLFLMRLDPATDQRTQIKVQGKFQWNSFEQRVSPTCS